MPALGEVVVRQHKNRLGLVIIIAYRETCLRTLRKFLAHSAQLYVLVQTFSIGERNPAKVSRLGH